MNNIDKYNQRIDISLEKIKKDLDYFKSFGDLYISQKIVEYLNNICNEMNTVKTTINDLEKNK